MSYFAGEGVGSTLGCSRGRGKVNACTPSRGEMPSHVGAIWRAGHLPLYIDRSDVEGHVLWEVANRNATLEWRCLQAENGSRCRVRPAVVSSGVGESRVLLSG